MTRDQFFNTMCRMDVGISLSNSIQDTYLGIPSKLVLIGLLFERRQLVKLCLDIVIMDATAGSKIGLGVSEEVMWT